MDVTLQCGLRLFLATLTYGAVAVPILHEFTPDQIHNIVNHSEAKILLLVMSLQRKLTLRKCLHSKVFFYLPDLSLTLSRTEKLTYAREHLNEMFGKKVSEILPTRAYSLLSRAKS